ncbi:hypothetical protein [Mycobacterium avium]|uniref:hypothetical protein n=1 Tax=Mycobacterium avium TaxID=1764 RepID=UPI000CE364E7|nr:hypothetical protein [Mycobacterium avium]
MTITPNENAMVWRDLADALTPQQIAYIEDWERRPQDPPRADGRMRTDEEHQASLLHAAREFVSSNVAGAIFADVAPPAEDGQHYPWEDAGDGKWTRFFVGTTRKLGDAEVFISGIQSSDGRINRSITISGAEDMDTEQARQFAVLLADAADEVDRLNCVVGPPEAN